MAAIQAKYNEQEYEVEMYIDDGSGSSKRFNINPSAIVSLTIEDTLADWVVKGILTLYTGAGVFEDRPSDEIRSGNNDFYIFRNDGNDTLHIKIFPIFKDTTLQVDRKHWEIVHKFAIYEVEDVDNPPGGQNMASSDIKCKKFYFWDRWYQQMITDTIEYSTATSPSISQQAGGLPFLGSSGSTPLGSSDDSRSILTGIAMKEIIEKSLTKNRTFFDLTYPTTIVGGTSDTTVWDTWDTGASNIFYTAPANTSAYDSLMYIYSRHISSKSKSILGSSTPRGGSISGTLNDFCILYKERGPSVGDEGYFALRPMSSFFEKAGKKEPGDFLIERFTLQGYVREDTKKLKLKAGPVSAKQNMQIGTSLGPYSTITRCRFVDMSPFINATEFRSRPVCSFNFKDRTYSIEFSDNSVTTAKKFIEDKYISQLYNLGGTNDKLSLITVDSSKASRNISPVLSLYGENKLQRQADGLQKLLKTGVFQNTAINFRVMGATNREPGRFILIDKLDGIEDTPYNNKFFGQWFIINVKHIFEGGAYYNEITAVKLHRIKPLPVTLPNTL
jgi:hypothetical protein